MYVRIFLYMIYESAQSEDANNLKIELSNNPQALMSPPSYYELLFPKCNYYLISL